MDKMVEELLKDRLPVHPKCRGKEFSEEQAKNLVSPECSRIEKLDDYGFGKVDSNGGSEGEVDIELCRCTTYYNPSYWWAGERRCPMADHYKIRSKTQTEKVRAGQQKQKKKK